MKQGRERRADPEDSATVKDRASSRTTLKLHLRLQPCESPECSRRHPSRASEESGHTETARGVTALPRVHCHHPERDSGQHFRPVI